MTPGVLALPSAESKHVSLGLLERLEKEAWREEGIHCLEMHSVILCLWNGTLTMSQAPSGSTREWFSRPNYTSIPWTLIKMKGPEPLLTP